MKVYKNGFNFGKFQITKREIIASITIIAILFLIGYLISSFIKQNQIDMNEIYNKAIKIEDTNLFEYGMKTNIGNAFVYGELKAVDAVTYPEINGQYMYIEKIKEQYTCHTRTIVKTKGTGKNKITYTDTEFYWTWDKVSNENKKSNQLSFNGINFNSDKFIIPTKYYMTTIKESSYVRYKYYVVNNSYMGTIFTDLRNNTISDNTLFYENKNTRETYNMLIYDNFIILCIFWFFWIVLIGGCVFRFYYIDNKWLE